MREKDRKVYLKLSEREAPGNNSWHLFYCQDISPNSHCLISNCRFAVPLDRSTFPSMLEVCYCSRERQHHLKKDGERWEERHWWNVNVLSCSISVSLVRGWQTVPVCTDVRINETAGGTTCGLDSTLFHASCAYAYPHPPKHWKHKHFMCSWCMKNSPILFVCHTLYGLYVGGQRARWPFCFWTDLQSSASEPLHSLLKQERAIKESAGL